MLNIKKTAKDLMKFIDASHSTFHVIKNSEEMLLKAGFTQLNPQEKWQLKPGGKHFVNVFGSTLVAFTIGEKPLSSLRVATSHTDFPCLRIKPMASVVENGYGKLNIEVYGGMIRNTWLDRPLSIAGKVVLKGKKAFMPRVELIDCKRPLLTIPNLAIHMNRKVNEGVELNPQKDMLPLMSMDGQKELAKDFFDDFLAEELKAKKEDILSYELTIYPAEDGCFVGPKEEFISSPRLDNLTSVKACLTGIINGKRSNGINVSALFDNEEVGSNTKQGADSMALPQIIERIYVALGYTREDYMADISGGFLLSADVAHAMHPNVPSKNDITNKPVLNGGVVLKIASSQAYVGDAEAIGTIHALCRDGKIPCQHFVNRSDERGGSTLGSMLTALMPMRGMDIGVPLLAMHSARETMGTADQTAIEALVCEFFSK